MDGDSLKDSGSLKGGLVNERGVVGYVDDEGGFNPIQEYESRRLFLVIMCFVIVENKLKSLNNQPDIDS